MLLLAIAAQLSAPLPIEPGAWFTAGDVPASLNPGAKGAAAVEYGLTVSPDGTAQDCFVERSSGDLEVDRHVCGIILRKAHFHPATGPAGSATYGVYRNTIEWFNGDGQPPKAKPVRLLDLTVVKLPSKTSSPAEVRVMFAVDAKGLPTFCRAESGDEANALSRAACSQILQSYTAIPARDASGNAVSSVQSAVVRFFKG
jgi:hypothetical protein